MDGNGVVYISGSSNGLWLGPTNQGPLNDYNGLEDIFVLELDSAGANQWVNTYGICFDEGRGIAVNNNGQVYSTGWSQYSWNGHAGQEPKHAYSGYSDIFVLKLRNVSGSFKRVFLPYLNE